MSNSCQAYKMINTLLFLGKYSSPWKQPPPSPPHGVRTKPSHLQSTLAHCCLILDLQHLYIVSSCSYNTDKLSHLGSTTLTHCCLILDLQHLHTAVSSLIYNTYTLSHLVAKTLTNCLILDLQHLHTAVSSRIYNTYTLSHLGSTTLIHCLIL